MNAPDRRVTLFRRLLVAVAVWAARWWLRNTPFTVARSSHLRETENRLVALHRLTYTSGHLTRACRAGRTIRNGTEAALDALLAAQGRYGCEFMDTYAAPLTRRLYGGEAA